MPYEWNWSQDVEKCTLDLVLSSSTRANTIQTIALASKGGQKFLQEALQVALGRATAQPLGGKSKPKVMRSGGGARGRG